MKKILAAGLVLATIAFLAAIMFGLRPVPSQRVSPVAPDSAGLPGLQGTKAGSPSEPASTQEHAQETQSQVFAILPDRQKLIGLKTTQASVCRMVRTIRTVGRIEIDERKVTTVSIRYEGWIDRLYADFSGKYVRRGEPLAEINSPEASSTQLEYLNLMKWKGKVPRFQRTIEFEWGDRYGTTGRFVTYDPELLVEVARQKFKLWGFTEKDIQKLEKTGDAYRTITLRSPVSGYVIEKPAFRGSRVAPGDKLFDIADLSEVWVLADVYEYELQHMKVGQPAKISLSNCPGHDFDSKIDFISPTLSGSTRTVKVRFVAPNPDGVLKPQMFADVEMQADLGERLAIPRDAVFDTGVRQVAYVDMGDGYFQARRVRTGMGTADLVEIISGLKPGERVVARPVFLVDSEAKLRGISGQ